MPSTPEQPHRSEDADKRDRVRSDDEQLRHPDESKTTEAFQRAARRVRRSRRELLDSLADK